MLDNGEFNKCVVNIQQVGVIGEVQTITVILLGLEKKAKLNPSSHKISTHF